MGIVVLLFTYFLTPNAGAEGCTLEAITRSIEVRDVGEPDDLQQVEAILCRVVHFAGPVPKIDLILNNNSMGFSYPSQLAIEPRYHPLSSSDPFFRHDRHVSSALWAHEFGHHVLGARMLRRHETWSARWLAKIEYESLQDKYQECARSTPRCSDFGALFNQIRSYWQERGVQKTDAENFALIYLPYDELFADVISVMATGDSSGMTNALLSPDADMIQISNAKLRDFSLHHAVEEGIGIGTQGHEFLAATRSWLWVQVLSSISINPDRARAVVDWLIVNIEAEIQRRLEASDVDASSSDVNGALIERLTNAGVP